MCLPYQVWSLLLVDSSRYLKGSLSKSPSNSPRKLIFSSPQSYTETSRLLCLSGSHLSSSMLSWSLLLVDSPRYSSFLVSLSNPDLFEVAPSSPCSQSSAFLLHWLTAESLRVHSLLPNHCLAPSLTSTRVLIGRLSSNK